MPSAASPHGYRSRPALERPVHARFDFHGPVGDRIKANVRNWLLPAPAANPAMVAMFRDRDRTPPRDLLPWSGEFAGKYLISAVQALRLTGDPALRRHLKAFVSSLIATQRADGYLGPFPSSEAMMGPGRWDLWGQYHVMLGLLEWWRQTGDGAALAACRRCADLFCATFLGGAKRVAQAGSEEMNESSIHIFTLLHRETGEPRYLQLAHEIEKDWEAPPSGDYVRQALAGKPFWQMPKPRWEGLHSVQAIAELAMLTGDEKYRQAYERIWWSIVEGDRHNTGGFSSGEQATGNPYDPRAIETCCTVAWMAVTLDYLRLTGDARAADELEISTWNAILGAQHPSGRWWTYNTPMDGDRKASAHEIVFQARPGSPELNCCSVNGPRGLGMLSEWAVMSAPDGLALNWLGPAALAARLPSGTTVRLETRGDYPVSGHVSATVHVAAPERFVLRLRIPGWSTRTRLSVNGQDVAGVVPGTYAALDREWRDGDRLEMALDMGPWWWVGEKEAAGKVSLYHGPVLLAYDPRFGLYSPEAAPGPAALRLLSVAQGGSGDGPPSILQARVPTGDGGALTLCDFASAGATGNRYVSWLPATGVRPAAFSRANPLRMALPR